MKKLLILIPIAYLILAAYAEEECVAADINWSVQDGAYAEGMIEKGILHPLQEAVPKNIMDGNIETLYGAMNGCATNYGCEFTFGYNNIITFHEPAKKINKVELVHDWGFYGYEVGGGFNWHVDLYYSGNWQTIASGTETSGTGRTDTVTGNWQNVSKIRITVDGSGHTGYAYPIQGGHHTAELRAWGPKNYLDVGLKIKNADKTVKIGVKNLEASHILRIRKNNVTYGIPLLPPDDSDASPIRMHDGTGIKALPKVE